MGYLKTVGLEPASSRAQEDSSLLGSLNLRDVAILLSILVAAKTALLLLVYLLPPTSVTTFPEIFPASDGLASLVKTLATQWDGTNYLTIAESGYPPFSPYEFSKLYAFSPVFPALIFLGHYLTGSYDVSSLLITNGLSLVVPILVLKAFDFRTALLLEVFPAYLVFTMVGYADVIALFFLALAFICFFKGRYLLTGLCLSGAACVSFALFLAAPAFLLFLLIDRRNRAPRDLLALSLPVILTGLCILTAYQLETGSPFTFFSVERFYWGVSFSDPVSQIRWLFTSYSPGSFVGSYWLILGVRLASAYWLLRNLAFEAFLFVGIFLLTRTIGPRRWLLILYCLSLSIPLLWVVGTPVYSLPRLMLPAFPFVAGYSRLVTSRWRLGVYVAASVIASGWAMITFVYAFFS